MTELEYQTEQNELKAGITLMKRLYNEATEETVRKHLERTQIYLENLMLVNYLRKKERE